MSELSNVTIVGGGTSGWITATYLARMFAERVQRGELTITLIESPDVGVIGVGESTARPITDFLKFIGLSERELIRRCNASFKIGGYFANWDRDEHGRNVTWVNPFLCQPDIRGVNPGYVYAAYGMRLGGGPLEEDFSEIISVCPALIRACRGPRRLTADEFKWEVPYSYHLDALELAKVLMETGKRLGVRQILDHVENVVLDEQGFVKELALRKHGAHAIEFVIDATGFAGLIIGKTLGEPFLPYDKYLLNDRAAVAQLPHEEPGRIEPTSRATALNAGWSFRVPLYNRVGSGYIYSSKFISDDEAIAEFKAFAGPAARDVTPRVIRMRIGRVRRSWVKNCVAMGLSSGFVEPLEATAIYSVQVALQHLISYFPDSDFDPVLARHYNKAIDGLYDEIVDYISLLFCISNRADTPYWRAVREEMEIPPRLEQNLELWRRKMPDAIDLDTQTFFTPTSYRALLFGKRFYSGRRHIQVNVSEQVWSDYLALRRARTQELLTKLPDHHALLSHLRETPADAKTSAFFSQRL